MNRLGSKAGGGLGKAALKTHALQTLRVNRSHETTRSVWSASDLSALSGRGSAKGSGSPCAPGFGIGGFP
jgi:hypothetical protein